MNVLNKMLKVLIKIERVVGAILLFTILTIVFVATVGRYTTWFRVLFSEELARFSMIWLVFIGSAVCAYNGNLFNVDLVSRRLSKHGQIIFLIIRAVLTVVFCAFAAKYGVDMVKRQLLLHQRSAMMNVPYAFMYSSIPVGSTLIALHYLVRVAIDYKELTNKGSAASTEGGK